MGKIFESVVLWSGPWGDFRLEKHPDGMLFRWAGQAEDLELAQDDFQAEFDALADKAFEPDEKRKWWRWR